MGTMVTAAQSEPGSPGRRSCQAVQECGARGPESRFDKCSSSVFWDVNYGWGMAFCFPSTLIIWECCRRMEASGENVSKCFRSFKAARQFVDPDGPFEPLFPLPSWEGTSVWVMVFPGCVSKGEAGSVLGAFSQASSPKPGRSAAGKLGQGSVCLSISLFLLEMR